MLSVQETIALFKKEVSDTYPTIKLLQRALYKLASPSRDISLSSARCLTTFSLSELFALFLDGISKVEFANTGDLSSFSSVNTILASFTNYKYQLNIAIKEAKDFLPIETIRVLEEFNSPESPLNQLNVAIFIILASNLE